MGYLKRLVLYIVIMVMSVFIIGCDKSSDTAEKSKEDSKETQIKKSFAKTLDMYSIKNLEELYDKEGYRDGEFEKGDKGMWTIYTDFAKSNKPGELSNEGMVLYLDRNTRTAKGYYFVRTFYRKDKLPDRKNYKVEMKNNKIILLDKKYVKFTEFRKKAENIVQIWRWKNVRIQEKNNWINWK